MSPYLAENQAWYGKVLGIGMDMKKLMDNLSKDFKIDDEGNVVRYVRKGQLYLGNCPTAALAESLRAL